MSEAFLQMACVFSQLELAMIRSRVRSGTANAKAKGKQIGRPQTTKDSIPAIFLRHYPAYKNGQLNITELSRVCDLSRTTIYKYISLLCAKGTVLFDNFCVKGKRERFQLTTSKMSRVSMRTVPIDTGA